MRKTFKIILSILIILIILDKASTYYALTYHPTSFMETNNVVRQIMNNSGIGFGLTLLVVLQTIALCVLYFRYDKKVSIREERGENINLYKNAFVFGSIILILFQGLIVVNNFYWLSKIWI